LVCQGGRRSRHVASLLLDLGYTQVRVVEGGMQAWRQKQLLTAVEANTSRPVPIHAVAGREGHDRAERG
jgi:3-mercaptopyruvate sulfurtransferase SseA